MDDAAGLDAFLGVSRSLSGRAWRQRPADTHLARSHGQRLGLSEPLARALASRGVTEDAAGAFLNPTLKALFPDPSSFTDMDRAAPQSTVTTSSAPCSRRWRKAAGLGP